MCHQWRDIFMLNAMKTSCHAHLSPRLYVCTPHHPYNSPNADSDRTYYYRGGKYPVPGQLSGYFPKESIWHHPVFEWRHAYETHIWPLLQAYGERYPAITGPRLPQSNQGDNV